VENIPENLNQKAAAQQFKDRHQSAGSNPGLLYQKASETAK
jgi:hypothetical protein